MTNFTKGLILTAFIAFSSAIQLQGKPVLAEVETFQSTDSDTADDSGVNFTFLNDGPTDP